MSERFDSVITVTGYCVINSLTDEIILVEEEFNKEESQKLAAVLNEVCLKGEE